ncbi:MAG: hypothetical protein LWY06_00755 [Firmicutes bacterium]|nr:hypothetical protein [Bacillota bacterium]
MGIEFTTKARTLEALQGKLKRAEVLPLFIVGIKDIYKPECLKMLMKSKSGKTAQFHSQIPVF